MPELLPQGIEILLVDDHALFRESVARLLDAEPGMEVVAHCGSIEEAFATLREKRVDIVLLDFDLGKRNGTEFMRLARQEGFSGKVLAVTAGVKEFQAAELIRAGISGIFMKHHSANLLAERIRDVMAGKLCFDQELLQAIVSDRVQPDPRAPTGRFTQRERQVLSHVFEGLGNKEIAGRIGVSESSVKATLQQLFSKTGVRTRSQLVRIVLEQYRNQL
jgi:two-component system, NarL family, nitrate/nitrite response regulator NarL